MRKHSKLYPAPRIKTHESDEHSDPKCHRQCVTDVSCTKIKTRFSNEILSTLLTLSVHGHGMTQIIGIGLYKQPALATIGASIANHPQTFGHVAKVYQIHKLVTIDSSRHLCMLKVMQFSISTFLSHQNLVSPLFYNAPFLHHNDQIGISNG